MENLKWLENWYKNNCDGSWEHIYGIEINTLDNPGWSVKIDLKETKFTNNKKYELNNDYGENDWIKCYMYNEVFTGCGDCFKLEMIIKTFREWINYIK